MNPSVCPCRRIMITTHSIFNKKCAMTNLYAIYQAHVNPNIFTPVTGGPKPKSETIFKYVDKLNRLVIWMKNNV